MQEAPGTVYCLAALVLKALISTATKRTERVFLVGLQLKSRSRWQVDDSLAELAELATTAGASVIGEGSQKLETPVARTFIGAGDLEYNASFLHRH